jgi:hypothetical protein
MAFGPVGIPVVVGVLLTEDGEEDPVAGDDGSDTAGDYDDGVDLLSSFEHS